MLYQLFWLFLAFSFLGWCLEVAATAVRLGQYRTAACCTAAVPGLRHYRLPDHQPCGN